jgi:hypothetical protein
MLQERTTLDWARDYIKKGFSVIPLIKGGEEPPEKFALKEYQKRKPTDEELQQWFGNGSNFNIGIVTGEISGIVVLDLDIDGDEAIEFVQCTVPRHS